ncbi:MAG: TIGR01777 family oxidoreductase [Cyclobacteriaceae bacterium]
MAHKILITGASGIIGSELTAQLINRGQSVSHLSRATKNGKVPSFEWNIPSSKINLNAFSGVDTIVHLAGAGVADKRWTPARRSEILESRIKSTQLLFEALKNNSNNVRTFVSASAIGYYGFEEDKVFIESDISGKDFLSQVTKQWEDEVDKISSLGIRVVKIRIGIVLSRTGGALEKIKQPISFFVGSPLGSGKQFMSWIHIDDLISIFLKAIEDEKMVGTYNAAASWSTNEEMTKAIAGVLRKPIWLPNVPSFILKIVLGEMASIILNGNKVSSEKITKEGFQFKFPKLEEALTDLIRT